MIDLRPTKVAESKPRPAAAIIHHDTARVVKSPEHEQRHLARFTDRFEKAREFGRSEKISRFGPDLEHAHDKLGNPTLGALLHPEASTETQAKTTSVHPVRPVAPSPARATEMPHLAVTHHEAMTRLAPTAPPKTPSPSLPRPRFTISPSTSRILATGTAIFIMAGYIWVQNFPKLALQTADNRAGIEASLPGYVPSSYSLARTNTSPGLVALNFSSPSAPTLTITQKQSNWDSNSLMDNYIAKQADDFSTINGEGLTIYIFGQNQATWVNRGIWFSITGSQQISKDDLLKIAYSL
jgi:hypothetical protein